MTTPYATVHDAWVAYSKIESHLRDATRLAEIIGKLFSARLAADLCDMTEDQHDLMLDVLLDRLRVETRNAEDIFDKANKNPVPR
jgi:hypothetical protein